MREIDDCIKARSFITSLKITNDKNIAFTTKLHGAKICNSQNCNTELNFANEHLNSDTTAISFNDEGTLLAFANDKIIYIVELKSKKIIKMIQTDNESIQLLIFDETSKHIIAGSKNGRVLHYRVEGISLICRLCSFPYDRTNSENIRQNYVSAFTFRGSRLATSGYGGTIHIIDINSRANTVVLDNGKTRTNALHFLDDDTVVSGNFDGVIKIFSIKRKRLIKKIDTSLTRIRQIIVMPNPNFIMLCSNTNYVSIIDIKNYKIVHPNYMEFDDIVTRVATLDEETVLVSLKNGQIQKLKLPSIKQLESLMLHNSLDKAFALVENEPMLQEFQQYEKLKLLYKTLYNDATLALINQNIALAKATLKPFEKLHTKQKEIALLFIAFKNYNRLKIFFLEKRYTLAYAICAKYPELENTPIYKKMEEVFKEVFKNAQRQVMLNQHHNAKALLNEYITIAAKRDVIELVLKQNKDFIQFIVAVNKEHYHIAYSLAQKNKLLLQTPTYTTLKKLIDKYLNETATYIQKGDTDSATKSISLLEDIVHLKARVRVFKEEIKNLQELQTHYVKNDFKLCYETIDKYPHLNTTELGVLLAQHWHKIIHLCEDYTLKGNITEIKKTLGELVTLKGRLNKIGDLFRVAYHIRIKAYIFKKGYKTAEKTIYEYVDIFGLDSEITMLMKRFEAKTRKKLAITQADTIRVTRDSWVSSTLILNNPN